MNIGYALSCEEFGPRELVDYASRAEQAGFSFALISDHYNPWTEKQGQSPFVWAVIGGIAGATRRLRLGTGVTCPIRRIHHASSGSLPASITCMFIKSGPTRRSFFASTRNACFLPSSRRWGPHDS